MSGFAEWLATTGLSIFIAQNPLAFPLLEILHVLAISVVLGTVFIFDLRLIGVSWSNFPAAPLLATLRPVALYGFVVAAASGALLFASQPVTYLNSLPFLLKLGLLAAAGLNLLLFDLRQRSSPNRLRKGAAIPLPVRLSALLSLTLWTAILIAGRFVGFFLQA